MNQKNRKYKNAEAFGLDFGLTKVEMNLIKEKKRIIEKLKNKRIKAGITQSALAKQIGSKQPAIARMESGQVSEVSMDFIAKIAIVLGISVSIKPLKKAAYIYFQPWLNLRPWNLAILLASQKEWLTLPLFSSTKFSSVAAS